MAARWALFLATLAAFTSGCVPFVVPPLRGQLGGGTPQSFEDVSSGESDAASDPAPTLTGRVGLNPLQMIRETGSRMFDVGAGYEGERSTQEGGLGRHGPYAEVAAFPLRGSAGGGKRYRVGVMTLGEYFVGSDIPHRGGATVAATAEIGGFSSGDFATKDAVGIATGEWALGVFAGPSVRLGAADPAWAGTVGITARLPMAAGFFCCLDLDAFQTERARKKHHEKKRHGRLRREDSTGARARSDETTEGTSRDDDRRKHGGHRRKR